jgi:hypothetical protein
VPPCRTGRSALSLGTNGPIDERVPAAEWNGTAATAGAASTEEIT